MASLINSGSIIDHVDKPAIHPDDAVYQALTPTSNGKVAVTVNGSSVTDYVHARGLIKAVGHATNYLSLKNGLKSGQEVHIRETGESKNVLLFVTNEDGNMLAAIKPGGIAHLRWYWTSATAGEWHLLTSEYAPSRIYNFEEMPTIAQINGSVIAVGTNDLINVHNYPDGLQLNVRNEGTVTLFGPVPEALGMNYTFDNENNEGLEAFMADEVTGGVTGKSAFQVGGPAFFASMKLSVEVPLESDRFAFGMRIVNVGTAGASATAADDFKTHTDLIAIGYDAAAAAPDIDLYARLNSGTIGVDNSGLDYTADSTVTWKVLVSTAGVCSFSIDGTTYAGTNAALTLDSGDIFTPFLQFLKDTTGMNAVTMQQMIVGYQ
jgi:hypothetical protein